MQRCGDCSTTTSRPGVAVAVVEAPPPLPPPTPFPTLPPLASSISRLASLGVSATRCSPGLLSLLTHSVTGALSSRNTTPSCSISSSTVLYTMGCTGRSTPVSSGLFAHRPSSSARMHMATGWLTVRAIDEYCPCTPCTAPVSISVQVCCSLCDRPRAGHATSNVCFITTMSSSPAAYCR